MRNYLRQALFLVVLWISATATWALSQKDGWYQIGSAKDLYAFAQLVSDGNLGICGELTADIDATTGDFMPIGSTGALYHGRFNGQGHRVKINIKTTIGYQGLFGCVTGGTVIMNTIIEGNVEAGSCCAGLVGGSNRYGVVAVLNCGNEANVTTKGGNPAGIIGCNMSSTCTFVIRNCYNTGVITGKEGGAITGWASNNSIIENCYSIGECDNFTRGTVGDNCFYGDEAHEEGLLAKLGDGFKAGESYPIPVVMDGASITRKIGSEAELEQFVNDVNNGQMYLSAELTADIDASNCLHNTVIGPSSSRGYSGIFDGKGHTLTLNMERDANMAAPFGYVTGTIKNLILDGSITTSKQYAASVCSHLYTPGQVRNIESFINFNCNKAGDGTHGGIVAISDKGGTVIENCAYHGSMDGESTSCAGVLAWSNSDYGKTQLNNCYITATFTVDPTNSRTIVRNPGSAIINNCYFLNDFGDVEDGIQMIDEEMLTCGELCYLLNGNQSDIQWYQTLGEDDKPTPFPTSKRVYGNGTLMCDGSSAGDALTYSNTNSSVIPDHDYFDGICQVCDALQPDYVSQIDDVYQIGDGAQLAWFSRWVNKGNPSSNAVLTADINMDEHSDFFVPIGTNEVRYKGNFDGQGHQISNLYIDKSDQYAGLFGVVTGTITIQNLTLDETCSVNCGGASVGLIGAMRDAGTVTMRNLGNKGEVMAAGVNAGGILGVNFSGTVVMENCFVTGYINGSKENGAISGWVGSGAKVTNCWSCAEVSDADGSQSTNFSRQSSATYTNCWTTIGTQVNVFDAEDLETGRLCYLINGDQSNLQWYQTLGKDEHPYPYSSHGQVYATPVRCDNLALENSTYTNAKASVVPDHKYVDGFCEICNHENPNAGFLPVIANADFDLTGNEKGWKDNDHSLTIVASVGEHYNHTFDTYQKIGDLQNGVYALQVQGFYRMGKPNTEHYEGGALNMDKAPGRRNSYFYAESDGINIATRFMDIMEDKQEELLNNGGHEVMDESTGCYIPDGTNGARKYFEKGLYRNGLRYVVVNAGDSLTLGMRNRLLTSGSWTCTDTWRLSYVGDQLADYQKMQQQLLDEVESFDEYTMIETRLANAYKSGVEALQNATTTDEILAAARTISCLPDSIYASALNYEAYDAAMKEVIAYLDEHDDFTSAERTLLEEYFEANTEPNEANPLGSYLYITEECFAAGDSLATEIARIKELLNQAIQNGISEGTNITHLIANADMSKASFEGWNFEITRQGSDCNYRTGTGFLDIFPVAETWNTAFDCYQQIGGNLPEGVYELGAYALYRPGANGTFGPSYVIPCQIYMNDFYTPVKNIYTDLITYDEAENGVNCRFDASGDESAPHNGEETWSQDYEVDGEGYVPEGQFAASFAFKGGRYYQKVYAVVTDGKMRVGIRNTGNPWYDSGLAMWGAFDLKYMAKNIDTENQVFDSFTERLENMLYLREDYETQQFFSLSHADAITKLIEKGKASKDADEKFELLKQINEEFKSIDNSILLFKQLNDLIAQFADEAGENVNLDAETFEEVMNLCSEAQDGIETGEITDEQAQGYINQMYNHPVFATIYAVGDLVDPEAENGRTDYYTNSYLYPIQRIEGTNRYEGTFVMQDRTNQANSNGRAGVYFRYRGKYYYANSDYQFFATPGYCDFKVDTVGHAFQTLGGEWKVEMDMDSMTVHFEPVGEAIWNNKVYCVGTLAGNSWQNNELAPLAHLGDGLYGGVINLQRGTGNVNPDTKKPYCELTLYATRSSDSTDEDSSSGRGSWTSCRYGSMTDKLAVKPGEKLDSLVRDHDRKWLIAEPGEYYVAFDMKNNCISIMHYRECDINGDGMVDGSDIVALVNCVIGNASRLMVHPAADVNKSGVIDGTDIVEEVNKIIMSDPAAKEWLKDIIWDDWK